MKYLGGHLLRLFKDEEGQGMVEYAILIALVAVAVIALVPQLREMIAGIFTDADTRITTELTGMTADTTTTP